MHVQSVNTSILASHKVVRFYDCLDVGCVLIDTLVLYTCLKIEYIGKT